VEASLPRNNHAGSEHINVDVISTGPEENSIQQDLDAGRQATPTDFINFFKGNVSVRDSQILLDDSAGRPQSITYTYIANNGTYQIKEPDATDVVTVTSENADKLAALTNGVVDDIEKITA